MSLRSFVKPLHALLTVADIQYEALRYGHQMSTKWQSRSPIPKRRGIKRQHGQTVEAGQFLVVQRYIRFHPGMHVEMAPDKTLVAMVPGTIRVTCEEFDPNFDNPLVVETFDHRRGQKMYKKYMHVIPKPQHNRFKLVDVV